jgi:hypothetical protein
MKNTVLALVTLAAIAGTATAEPGQRAAATNPHANQLVNKAVVLDVVQSPMYTYLQVSRGKGAVWIAAYKNDIKKGDTVRYSNGAVMTNFTSKSLNRTFDEIVFVDFVVPANR